MRFRLLPVVVVAGVFVAGCQHSGSGTDSSAPSKATQEGSSEAGNHDASRAGVHEPGPFGSDASKATHRRLLTKDRPPWPDPWPEGCNLLVSVAADVLPSGR